MPSLLRITVVQLRKRLEIVIKQALGLPLEDDEKRVEAASRQRDTK